MCSDAIGLGVSVKIPRSAFDSDPAPRLDEQRRLGTSGRDSRPGFGEVTSGIGDGLLDVGQRSVRIVNARKLTVGSECRLGRLLGVAVGSPCVVPIRMCSAAPGRSSNGTRWTRDRAVRSSASLPRTAASVTMFRRAISRSTSPRMSVDVRPTVVRVADQSKRAGPIVGSGRRGRS